MAKEQKRVMFYLPVVTPWWFANIAVHLVRTLARVHEIHVLVPPLWRNTGLGEDQFDLIADLDHVRWYLLDGADHPQLRNDASAEHELITLVHDINPDLTLCRSADIATPALFPGVVRYIMEGGAPPFKLGANWVTLSTSLFDHGQLPELSDQQSHRLDQIVDPLWAQMEQQHQLPSRAEFLMQSGLPDDKIIIGLPLEYEHEENFFGQHHRYSDNAAMIAALASELNDDVILAVTNHPLNALYGDNRAIDQVISEQSDQVVLLENTETAGNATLALSCHSDGMIVGNSKSWSACAAFGTPMMRLSDFTTGDWVQAYDDLPRFLNDIAKNTVSPTDITSARRWFAFHLANSVFDPTDPNLTDQDIVSRMTHAVEPLRWDNAIARYHGEVMEQAA